MMHPLKLSTDQLAEIALDFENRVSEGLATPNRQIRCLPTYIPLDRQVSEGQAFVLDLGGSNLRAGVIKCEKGQWELIKRTSKLQMPWERNDPFDRNRFLDILANALVELDYHEALPLGYCFSYPAEPTPDRDVILLKWAKGIDVPGTLDRKMGQLLLEHLSTTVTKVQCNSVTVINDTVAALVAGMADAETTSTIGLIAGTGTNMAAAMDPADIPKLSAAGLDKGLLPVVLESGNYLPPYLSEWDDEVDRESNNPGEQRFEKAVSGAYLGYLFKALFPDIPFDESQGGAGLVSVLKRSGDYPVEVLTGAGMIYHRSADLVAAALSGLIQLLYKRQNKSKIRIVAEGALFWGQVSEHDQYRQRVETTLRVLLKTFNLDHLIIELFKKEDANLIGSAIAALS